MSEQKKRIIITTGYMGSGSSAATDLVSEFRDVRNDFGDHEYIFLSCPDGLFDLEDKLLYGNNAIRSDEALRSFEKRMKQLYDKKFWWVGNYKSTAGNDFMKYTNEFLEEIILYDFPGYWYMHELPDWKMLMKLTFMKPFKILFGKIHNFKKITRYDARVKFSFMKPEVFYPAAKKYIYQIINMITQGNQNVVLDQLLLPFNMYRMDNYFDDDAFSIIVDRDPRDVFILNKYVWSKINYGVPFPYEVNEFCSFYRDMRESERIKQSAKILRIHFEDLIYKYEDTVSIVRNHLHFDREDHIEKRKRFNPDISINNTQLFHSDKYRDEILIIEEKLKDYLYEFPYVLYNGIEKTVD